MHFGKIARKSVPGVRSPHADATNGFHGGICPSRYPHSRRVGFHVVRKLHACAGKLSACADERTDCARNLGACADTPCDCADKPADCARKLRACADKLRDCARNLTVCADERGVYVAVSIKRNTKSARSDTNTRLVRPHFRFSLFVLSLSPLHSSSHAQSASMAQSSRRVHWFRERFAMGAGGKDTSERARRRVRSATEGLNL